MSGAQPSASLAPGHKLEQHLRGKCITYASQSHAPAPPMPV